MCLYVFFPFILDARLVDIPAGVTQLDITYYRYIRTSANSNYNELVLVQRKRERLERDNGIRSNIPGYGRHGSPSIDVFIFSPCLRSFFTFVFPTVLCFYIFFSTVLSATTSYAIRYIVFTRRTNPGSSEKPLGLHKNRSTL